MNCRTSDVVEEWSERWDTTVIPYNQWADDDAAANGSTWSNEEYNDDELVKGGKYYVKENNNRINGKIINGFDAPYVTKLYQLCYDTGIEGESLGNNAEDELWSHTKDEEFRGGSNGVSYNEEEINQNSPQQQNDPEEIRRKLAPEVSVGEEINEIRPKKNSLKSTHQLYLNLTDFNSNIKSESIEKIDQIQQHSGSIEHSKEIIDIPNNENIIANGNAAVEEAKSVIEKQAKLGAEARIAMAQAKQMARMQMEVEKPRKKKSPIADIVGIQFPGGKWSRQILSSMNFAQIQIILNDLHTQIESLNMELVELLEERDDLLTEQDSMLHRVERLTPY